MLNLSFSTDLSKYFYQNIKIGRQKFAAFDVNLCVILGEGKDGFYNGICWKFDIENDGRSKGEG